MTSRMYMTEPSMSSDCHMLGSLLPRSMCDVLVSELCI